MIKTKHKVSVVIPSAHNAYSVEQCLHAILEQKYTPAEILIIDSYRLNDVDKKRFSTMCQKKCMLNIISCNEIVNPGAARNIGIKNAICDYIAFVDVMTLPRKGWLSSYLKEIDNKEDVDILWGATVYLAGGGILSYVRDAVYGVNPIRTIPGSVIKKSVFEKVGCFLESVRAGEDSEWIRRSHYFNLVALDREGISTDYYGLLKTNFISLMKKWLTSYHASGVLDFYRWQKHLFFFILFPYIIFIAYIWNDVFIGWQQSSIFFIPHITKIVSAVPLSIYFFYRGMLLPYIKGVSVFPGILPLRFVALFSVGMILDMVKFYAFITMFQKKKVK